jgi:hypothetical protein
MDSLCYRECRAMRTPPYHLWNHYGFVSNGVYFDIPIHEHFQDAALPLGCNVPPIYLSYGFPVADWP